MEAYNLSELALTLFEEAGDALVLFDPDSEQILDVNPMAQRLSGFTRNELLHMQASFLFRSEEQGGLARLRHAFRKTEVFHSQEGFLLRNRQDGVWIPLNLTLARLHVKPKTLGLITARDVHEQRDAHAKLKKAEQQLRTVVTNAPVILFALDRKGAFTLTEGKGLEALELQPEELIGKSVFDVYGKSPQILRNVHRVLSGEAFTEVVELSGGPGAGRNFEIHYTPLRDRQEQVIGAIGVASDITERRRAEEALRDSEAFYHSLVENLPQNILRKDVDGRFTFANQRFCAELGQTLESIVGKTDFDFFPPHLAEKYRANDQLVMDTGETLETVEEHMTPAGERLYVQIIKSPLYDARRDILGTQVIFWNVTRQKRAERRLVVQHAVTRVLAEANTLEEASQQLLEALGSNLGCDFGSLWIVDRRAGAIRCLDVWNAPNTQAPEMEAATRETTCAPGEGLPGRIWASAQPLWIADLRKDGNFLRVSAATRNGLHGAVGLPILLGNEVLGAIEFVRRTLGSPDDDLLQLFAVIGSQIGQFVKRKRAEEKLRQSEERFRLLVEGVKDYAIFLLDPQGQVASWNAGAERIKGYRAEEIIGQPFSRFYLCEEMVPHKPQENLKRAAAEGRHEDETWWLRKDGSRFWANVIVTTLGDAGGNLKGFSVIVRDLTERKRIEEAENTLRAHEVESNVARQIQSKLFPVDSPQLIGFDIGGLSCSAVATGGDYFDYIPMLDGGLGVVIGDAAGHGSGPALLMASTRAYLRALALTHTDVGNILTLANRVLASDVGDRFVTLILARVEPATRSFVYASAGHHPEGYLLDASGQVKMLLKSTSFPLGIVPDAHYVPGRSIVLDAGEIVLLLTDGIVEASSFDGTPFGIERALEIVRANLCRPAQEIVGALYAGVNVFCAGCPPLDDLTAVVLKVNCAE